MQRSRTNTEYSQEAIRPSFVTKPKRKS